MFIFLRKIPKRAWVILFIMTVISLGSTLFSYFRFKEEQNQKNAEIQSTIVSQGKNLVELTVKAASGYLTFGTQYMNLFTIFNSSYNHFIMLSPLNNAISGLFIRSFNVVYNVSDTQRSEYENRMSEIYDEGNVSISNFNDLDQIVISPKKDWYCPLIYSSPNKTVYPGLDLCSINDIKDTLDKQSNNVSLISRIAISNKEAIFNFILINPNGFSLTTVVVSDLINLLTQNGTRYKSVLLLNDEIIFTNQCTDCVVGNSYTRNITDTFNLQMIFYFPPNIYDYINVYNVMLVCMIFDSVLFVFILIYNAKKIRYDLANEMLGYVNHEVRNPLNCIKGLIEISILDLDIKLKPDIDSVVSNLASAKNACDLLTHIVSDILEFKKITDGKLEIHITNLITKEFHKNLLNIIKGKLSEKPQIEFSFSNPDNIASFNCDYNRLIQILLNFLTNSIKFTDYGTIELIMNQTRKGIKFSVHDTGRGIPKNQQKKIFKPFSQTINIETFRFSGVGNSGLGLYLCKMLIDVIGGEIGFKSEIDVGSTFWIIIYNSNQL